MAKDKRIVITGIGPVSSVGIGIKDFWRGILERRTGLEIVESLIDGEIWDKYWVHRVKDFNLCNFNLDQNTIDYIEDWKEGVLDLDLQYLLAATKLALDDAGIDYNSAEKNKLALIVANENPGMENFIDGILQESFNQSQSKKRKTKKDIFNSIYYKIVKRGYETQSFMTLFHLAKIFKVHEYSLFINNACASGLYGIEAAHNLISLNKASMVIVVAGDHPNIYKHLWFKMLEMYEEDGKIKPFSNNAKGLVMGEGAAALILEDYEHALERNAHIYAECLGSGFRMEGWQVYRPKIGSFSYHEAIIDSLSNSHLSANEIDLICLHGFGTLAGDFYEAKAVMDILGSKIATTSFKPYVGHNLGGSTLLEVAVLLLVLKNNIIPPILNTTEINPRIKLDLVLEERQCSLKYVMKTCAAFAGYNAATIFKKLD